MYSVSRGQIRGIFNPEFALSKYNLIDNEMTAIEVLTKQGRNAIREYYCRNPAYLNMNPDALLQCLVADDDFFT